MLSSADVVPHWQPTKMAAQLCESAADMLDMKLLSMHHVCCRCFGLASQVQGCHGHH
jgi:hypothetical protein